MLKLLYNTLISHTSKVTIKILQARLRQYVNFVPLLCPNQKGQGASNMWVCEPHHGRGEVKSWQHGSGLNGEYWLPSPCQSFAYVLTPGTWGWGFIWIKRIFANIIKDLQVRSAWMIQVSPQCSDKCPEKHAEREAHSGEDLARTGAGSWRDRRRFSSRTFGGGAALQTPWFWTCCFMPPSLWCYSNPRKRTWLAFEG